MLYQLSYLATEVFRSLQTNDDHSTEAGPEARLSERV